MDGDVDSIVQNIKRGVVNPGEFPKILCGDINVQNKQCLVSLGNNLGKVPYVKDMLGSEDILGRIAGDYLTSLARLSTTKLVSFPSKT